MDLLLRTFDNSEEKGKREFMIALFIKKIFGCRKK